MFLSETPLIAVTESDLERLIADGVPESRELEYKRDRIGSDDNAKREFLKDVTAFANTQSGHIVIGMDASGGVPTDLSGITGTDPDSEKQRLQNMLRDAVQPALLGVQMHEVPRAAGGFALILRIPRSWNPPHRVSFRGWNRFFLRHSSGVEEMDVEQLRAVFLGASEMELRVRRFQEDRVQAIKSGRTPVRVESRGCAVLHIVPLGGETRSLVIEQASKTIVPFGPIYGGGSTFTNRPNFDGLLTFVGSGETPVPEYTQLYRNGRIEAVLGRLVREADQGRRFFREAVLRNALVQSLPAYLNLLNSLGFGPPYVTMLSLVGVGGSSLGDEGWPSVEADRDDLLLEPIRIEVGRLEGDWHPILRPLLDTLWNVFGFLRSPDFSTEGKWKPRRG